MPFADAVPVFKLYGEQQGWPTPDLLHCESIHQRSRLYEWHIRAHQHAELVQLLYLHQGEATIEIEGRTTVMRDACIQIVPALCVHGFRFSPGTQGYVLSLALPLLSRLEAQFPQPLALLNTPQCVPVAQSRRHIRTLFSALRREYQTDNEARDMMLFSLLSALLVWLRRQHQPAMRQDDKLARRRSAMRLFARQIERHYREHLPLTEYARRVGLSANYLNQLCREFHNCSALFVLHQRLMLEAKRSLQYTCMTVNQISDYLGFSDVTYFSRFFKKHQKISPKAYREIIKKNHLR
ncbi:helix-turn-helix domain-containing protein [Citrobacter rodentium]|uniref:AraC-family transcriptional regulator n=2 Tax=Citrobacter rodentium TaxID=67825 RepID=D2TRW0_CITRI|nr:helix-turn-helix domain-containing protein [Citrobacter rodentium]KIQ50807.1 AraC family transcriptional regulator [Citrobacter rodentium]QBY31081.1 helix-turn-helix domain-containing protein [Citrobacter rodentium]UHO31550.1 helix-turn-helix domain-containing protein [Citrobacter rodentium NBRC 105723 = DSM 16636]CBG91552.1 AraC-family transcriptional regulator [Citrobacter rodentium ICC168]HAT8013254.1 AraC family transcriptional regulator [Citrobacter rodentium NBRC 105723 = DSM 16636]